MECFPFVDPETVESACLRRKCSGKISAALRFERMESSLRLIFRAAFQDNIQAFCFRRPDPKMRQTFSNQLCPDRVATLDSFLRHLTPSTGANLAVVPDFSFRVRHQELQAMGLFHARNHRTLHEMAACAVARGHG